MFEPSNFNDNIFNQLLNAQRVLSDLSARLVQEADASARRAALLAARRKELGVPFGYTNSLEGLIQDGSQYGTIYAEPPWPCDDQPTEPQSGYRKLRISVDAIAALPVRQLAAASSHLHLWTPDRFLRDSMQILDAWGFTYKGSLVMVSPELGNGVYWGTGHKYLLLGVRGDAPFSKLHPRSWFFEAENSIGSDFHPFDVKSLIEQVSPSPRLHLFKEGVYEGWTSWGQTVPSNYDEDDDYPDEDDIIYDNPSRNHPPALVADSSMVVDVATEKPTR